VDDRLTHDESLTEQQLLDTIRVPGYTNRKARKESR
jgi:hypothetical protein